MTSSDAPAATPDASPAAPAAPADDVAAPSEPSSTAASSAGGEQEERQLHPTKEAYLPVVKEDINKDIRVGVITAAKRTPKALVPAFYLTIDFGPVIGERHSSTQIAECYDTPEELVGTKICCVVNVDKMRLGRVYSTCLTLGVEAENGGTCLVRPDPRAKVGSRVF